jgi:thioredoxin reductase (NADPH)
MDLSADGVREILKRFPDLGDVILQAFIARRQLLREPANFTGLRVVGSRYSQDTLRIREFLAKIPFTIPRSTSCSSGSG